MRFLSNLKEKPNFLYRYICFKFNFSFFGKLFFFGGGGRCVFLEIHFIKNAPMVFLQLIYLKKVRFLSNLKEKNQIFYIGTYVLNFNFSFFGKRTYFDFRKDVRF